jgi:hypothetical protein
VRTLATVATPATLATVHAGSPNLPPSQKKEPATLADRRLPGSINHRRRQIVIVAVAVWVTSSTVFVIWVKMV